MSKIGTAHLEIKPVLNETALKALTDQIESAIGEAVAEAVTKAVVLVDGAIVDHFGDTGGRPRDRIEAILEAAKGGEVL